jgi:hypothetical protein
MPWIWIPQANWSFSKLFKMHILSFSSFYCFSHVVLIIFSFTFLLQLNIDIPADIYCNFMSFARSMMNKHTITIFSGHWPTWMVDNLALSQNLFAIIVILFYDFLLLLCMNIVNGTCDITGLYSSISRSVSPFPIGVLSACVLLIRFHCILHFLLLLLISLWNIQDSSQTVFWHENIILLNIYPW